MAAKINIRHYVIFTEPRKFDTQIFSVLLYLNVPGGCGSCTLGRMSTSLIFSFGKIPFCSKRALTGSEVTASVAP